MITVFLVLQTVGLFHSLLPTAGLVPGQRTAPDKAAGLNRAFVRLSDNNPTVALLRAETGWMAY